MSLKGLEFGWWRSLTMISYYLVRAPRRPWRVWSELLEDWHNFGYSASDIITVIHRLMIHPKYKYCFDKIFQLVKIKIIMTICLKSTRTHFQNMKLIEWSLSEIQVKHWCIIEWEYITAKHDFAVAQPNIIHFTWNFVRSIIKYITMFLFIHLKNNTFMCDVIRVYHWVVVYHWTVDGCIQKQKRKKQC